LGFVMLCASLFYMTTHLSTQMDFRTAVLLRVFQSAGLAFLFVPIQTIVYAGLPPEKNNASSGIVNLARNMRGDIGIALVTTLIARRAQVHQATLGEHVTALSPIVRQQLDAVTLAMTKAGAALPDAQKRAAAVVYRQLQQQAATAAYVDTL